MNKIYLMDASAFIHRSFHAIRNLKTKNGFPTGAIYGFTATVLKLFKDMNPKYLALVFDSKEPGHRKALYPEYKANRPPMPLELVQQQEYIRNISEALGCFCLNRPGFEADDLIASLVKQFTKGSNDQIVIVSADKDFYQLLSENVSMYDPDPKKTSAMTLESFKEKFLGLEPESFLDMQALMGDSSDNIPGVPKVGEKTAFKLMTNFKTLDNLYNNLSQVSPESLRANLEANRKSAYLSKDLATLGHGAETSDINLADLILKEPDANKITEFFQKLEFNKLLKEVFPTGSLFDMQTEEPAKINHQSVVSYKDYKLVIDDKTWLDLKHALESAKQIALDLETNSLKAIEAEIVGISLCAKDGQAFYIPISHNNFTENQSLSEVLNILKPYLIRENIDLIGQNAKYDWLILSQHGLELPPPKGDPMLASYLLNPEDRHGLDYLSPKYLEHQPIAYKDVVEDKKKTFRDVTLSQALDYAGEDADVTLRLSNILSKKLQADPKLWTIYNELELPLEHLLCAMEKKGVLIDSARLNKLSSEFEELMIQAEEKIYSQAGRKFNIGSPKQLSELLFNEMGLPYGKKTKTGYSTDTEVLSELALAFPIASDILTWRTLSKLKSTYTDKLPKEINSKTGRVHTSYNQTLTATGRLSSSEPNLQNIPIRGETGLLIRSAFIAPEGYCLISADYSQVELRVLAHFSNDASLLKAFRNDEDIHTEIAAQVLGKKHEDITPDERREAKTINFGIVYGQGPFALSRQLGISQAKAKEFIERYFERFPGIKTYMEQSKKDAHQNGYVSTWFGRKRVLSGLAGGYQARMEAERIAINTPIQGTAADLIKIAMITLARRLEKEHPRASLIMQVHDELIIEAPLEEAGSIKNILKEEMSLAGEKPFLTNSKPLSVKLKVDVGQGSNWSEAH